MVVFSTHDVTVTWNEIHPGFFVDFARLIGFVVYEYDIDLSKTSNRSTTLWRYIHLNIKIDNVGINVLLPNYILKTQWN